MSYGGYSNGGGSYGGGSYGGGGGSYGGSRGGGGGGGRDDIDQIVASTNSLQAPTAEVAMEETLEDTAAAPMEAAAAVDMVNLATAWVRLATTFANLPGTLHQ